MKVIAQLVSKPILNKHASKSICTKFQPSATFCARITNAYWTIGPEIARRDKEAK